MTSQLVTAACHCVSDSHGMYTAVGGTCKIWKTFNVARAVLSSKAGGQMPTRNISFQVGRKGIEELERLEIGKHDYHRYTPQLQLVIHARHVFHRVLPQ